MEKFVRLISEKYKKENKPMSIVDIGCGYGKQAYNMKKKLEAEGVQI
jgi:ubiquinone/menaquinone biosynthesis C-methylase UbiE